MFKKILQCFMVLILMSCMMTQPMVMAAEYNIKQMTTQVKTALEGRRDRYNSLKALKQSGKVGEDNRGYVHAFVDEAQVKSLAAAENSDRKTIYKTIAEQNNISHALGTIETVFAKTQREKAESGEKIQLEDGSWVTK